MTTIIGLIVLLTAGFLVFRVTAFAARALLSLIALVGLLIILVPLLIASG